MDVENAAIPLWHQVGFLSKLLVETSTSSSHFNDVISMMFLLQNWMALQSCLVSLLGISILLFIHTRRCVDIWSNIPALSLAMNPVGVVRWKKNSFTLMTLRNASIVVELQRWLSNIALFIDCWVSWGECSICGPINDLMISFLDALGHVRSSYPSKCILLLQVFLITVSMLVSFTGDSRPEQCTGYTGKS